MTITVKGEDGNEVLKVNANPATPEIQVSDVGGLRYSWMSWMNAASVEVDDLKVLKVDDVK